MELGAIAIGALALLITAGVVGFRRATFRLLTEPWYRAARAGQLTDVRVGEDFGPWLRGKADRLSVELKPYTNTHEHGTRIVIGGLRYWPGDFSLRSEEQLGALEKISHKELVIGDPGFDKIAFVQGTPELVHAVLDFKTRALLAGLLQGRYRQCQALLCNQELRIDVAEDPRFEHATHRVTELLPAMIEIAKRLVRPADIAGRLAHNAQKDPLPAVRLANLQLLLVKHDKKTPIADKVLRAALDDPDEEVRLSAAAALDEDGRPTLLKVAFETTDDGRAARAVQLLGESLPASKAQELLEQSLRGRRVRTMLNCIATLGRMRRKEALDLLRRIVETEPEELAVAAARALGMLVDPACEAPLVSALGRDARRLVVAAAESLGKAGSVSAVAALQEAAGRHWPDGDVRRATRQAIAEIQSRLTGASPGQLSLASVEAGQVSLAEGEESRGRLSSPSDEAE
jgi:HEAT repeat protein